ncbi:dethiobiotin synthase [Hydrogenovibrio sp. 3SP14C1]|uniref:dethiobiotin synthase n=1 Tax=Hydrogenovibrio sp. 3SP14C1 TaxID=3038774 RepID=UPI002417D1F7|nr:dethiobiotin synthase [Hydrogenovibrio sp. 3SP14C1]MDG4812143.1 dethiobiotin synthase [Hydrogenovibrio sp. 3SP14C1]
MPFAELFQYFKTTQPGGFFITGTDTDIGKTFVSCAIARSLLQKQPGLVISPRKPIASGALKDAYGELYSEDAVQLHQACQSQAPLKTVCPYLLEPAISPARAIQQAEQTITIQDLALACMVPQHTLALVEGAGGIYSPLASDGLNIDLAKQLGYPVILVVGNKLGCLNHALLSIDAIEKSGLDVAHIFINNLSEDADFENLKELQSLTDHPVSLIPYQA